MDIFFFIGSLYSYFGVMRAGRLAREAGVPLAWRPFSVRAIMVEQNNVLSKLGKDAQAIIAQADSAQVRKRFDDETDAARRLGIFGAPTFAVGSEIFWGDDRLEDAIEWARRR